MRAAAGGRAFLVAAFGAWAAWVLLTVAPGWLPSLTLLRNLGGSLFTPARPDAGWVYAIHHHLEMTAKVAVLHLVLAGAGRTAARWLAPRGRPGWLVGWGIGFGLISLQTLGFGLTRLLFAGPVLLVALPWAGVAALRLRAERPWAALPGSVGADPLARLFAGACAAAVAGLGAYALAPDSSWDAVVYHLRVPAFFIQEHLVFHMPTHHFTVFPLGAEMLNAWLMLWGGLDRMGGGQAPKLFHFSCAVVGAWCARRIALRLTGDAAAGWLAAALLLLCPFTGTIAIRAYNDFGQAAFAGLVAVLLVERPRGALALAGALAGVALSCKYTAVMIVLAAGAAWWRLRPLPYLLAGGPLLPWLLKNALMVGNPVAPFAVGLFSAAPETGSQLAAYAGSVGQMTLAPRIVSSTAFAMFVDPNGETLSELLPLLLAAALVAPPPVRRPGARVLAVFAVGLVALWAALSPAIRFFAPALPPLAALAAASLPQWRGPLGAAATPLFAVAVALNLIRLPIAHSSLFVPLPFLAGRGTIDDYAGRLMFPAPHYGQLARWIDGNTPPRARVLVLIDIKAHYVWRRTYHDFQYVKPGLLLRWLRAAGSVDGLVHKLKEEGITHVMVVRQMTRDVGWHLAWTGRELAQAAEFFSTRLRPLYTIEGGQVAEVLDRPGPRRPLDAYAWMLYMEPENLLLLNREPEAVAILEDALKAAPWLPGARAYLGMAYGRLQRYAEAVPVLRRAVAEGGDHAPLSAFVLGQILEFRGDRRGAERAWRDAVRLDPRYGEAHERLALLLAEQDRLREAFVEADQAARLAPDNADWVRARQSLAERLGTAP